MPVGPASAPVTDNTAAPGYVADPVATPTTPRLYLSEAASGRGHHETMSDASGTRTAGVACSVAPRPMSTRSTWPVRAAAGPTTCAALRHPKVTVTSACTALPGTSPVSTATPLGTSTATTGVRVPARFRRPP